MNRFTINPHIPDYSNLSVVLLHAGSKIKSPAISYLHKQLDIIHSKYDKAEIILVLGNEYETILKKFDLQVLRQKCRIIINIDANNNSSAFSAWLAMLSITNKNVLILYGDYNFSSNDLPNKMETCIASSQSLKSGVGLTYDENSLINMSYGIDNKWPGIFMMTEQNVKLFLESFESCLLMYEIINKMLDRDCLIKVMIIE